jgi:activator of HSP90 ATPase
MRAAFFALALLPSAALATITINTPSSSSYWVQNVSNTIGWTYTSGDPTPVDIIITNGNNATLNGDFSIARFVPVSQQAFTVTNVTLLAGTGYQVVFVNPTNASQVYANSSNFEVKASGTSPAPTSTPSPSGSSSGNSVASSGTKSSTSPSSTSSSTSKKNSALGMVVDVPGLLYASSAIVFGAFFL